MPTDLKPIAAALLTLGVPCLALSQNQPMNLGDVAVTSTRADLQGVAGSASEGIVTSKQIQTRPLLRAGDVMEAVPGLVATQHAGEGKANQYFLRGFNLDHGTDFATYVDGVPVNLPTHGHGHGYTDLYFLIPELVDVVQYRKGPYYAEEGDFSAAGSARIRTVRKLPAPLGLAEVGSHGYRRLLAAGSLAAGGGDLLLAGEKSRDNGPWTVSQNLRKTNLFGKFTLGEAQDGLSLGFTHYEAQWTSTDQIPQRAVDQGLIGRFDSLDPTAGGRTRRTGLQAEWSRPMGNGNTRVQAYAVRYAFDLFSNFTYFTRGCDAEPLPAACDPAGALGQQTALDQFEQVDRRTVSGLSLSHRWPTQWAGTEIFWTMGTDLRRDRIGEVGLYDTQARTRLARVRSDEALIDALALWGQAEVQVTPQLRAVGGLRWDHRTLDVTSSLAANSGQRNASIASPKASLIYTPNRQTDLYANWGRGYHSNDARGAVIRVDPRDGVTPVEQATPLVRATGFELGARQRVGENLSVTGALWALKLDSELLFVGDAGTTEPSRPSGRSGIELTANWKPAKAWEIDADLSISRARFRDADPAGDRIPGAMERVLTVGATWAQGPWTVGARLRHFGSRPLVEDNSLRGPGSTVVNVHTAWRYNATTEISFDVFNLLNRRVNDIEYAYASRLPGEPAFADGVTPNSLHVHPSVPRTARLGLKLRF